MVENKTIRKQFLFTSSMTSKLKKVSEIRGESQNEIVNKALAAYLSRFDKKLEAIDTCKVESEEKG